ncbi:MAG: SpoIIE family protein phosphatase [Leptospira sp.]|nr:SpoIIE family protein phosphatase [Leptospira sp.]
MKKILFFVSCFVFNLSTYALPIDLTKNWQVTNRWTTDETPNTKGWDNLESLPLQDAVAKMDFPEDKLRYVTMYKTFLISDSDMDEVRADAFSLHVPYISNVHRIYLNEVEIHSAGTINEGQIVQSGYRRHIILPLDRKNIRLGQNSIRILVASEHGEELNVYKLHNDIFTKIDTLSANQTINEEYFTYMLLFLYFFVGLYHGLFYLKRKMETYNLYYALFGIFLSIYMVFRSQAIYQLSLDPYVQSRIEYFVVFYIPIWMLLFSEHFFLGKVTKFGKSVFGIIAFISILQIFVTRDISGKILLFWQLSIMALASYNIFIITRAVIQRNRDAYRIILGFLILIVCGAWDILGATGLLPIQNLNLLRFGFLSFVLGIAVVLANRFLRVHREVEILNATLERKVEERTNELQNTLTHVQELKVQQDGDYFLTSLLLDPLSAIHGNSNFVAIESYTKQKKEFEFRGKKREIGGDIIISEKIILGGKTYIVFINGDAMGKSIQGAGGALVLGVVFLSVLKRTQSKAEYRNKSPERWIKDCFLELQSIFESFDGSMLISVVLGLIEEHTGVLYYINAEHPWTVLYRDGVASFIEQELELRKIGIKGMAGDIRVRVFALEHDDVLFVGSDGRDDIVVGLDETGHRVINEDENQFLRRVEEAKGKLPDLIERLREFGGLSDDLTLLRVEWLGNVRHLAKKDTLDYAGNSFPNMEYKKFLEDGHTEDAFQYIQNLLGHPDLNDEIRPYFLKEAARLAIIIKNYDYAIETIESILPSFSTDNELLLQLSYAFRKTKQMVKAIDMAERIRSRDPKHFRNLLHLAECYRYVNQVDRAKKLYSKVVDLNPEHPQVLKLHDALFGKSLS